MPQTILRVFRHPTKDAPLLTWLEELEQAEPKAYVRCLQKIQQLEQFGYELRRPAADHLGDGIYELRTKLGRVHYRILYFFHGKNVACITHGFTKEGAIPDTEIERAKRARKLVKSDLDKHTAEWEL